MDPVVAKVLLENLKADCLSSNIPLPEVRLFLSGEPLRNNKFVNFLHITNDLGYKTLVHTNGTLISRRLAKKIGKVKHHNLTISVSLDGGDEETYKQMRGLDFFNKVSAGIVLLCEHANCNVVVQCLLEKQVYLHAKELIERKYKSYFPSAKVYVRPLHNWNKKDSVEGSTKLSYGTVCDFLMHDLVIYSDLRVGLCCACLNGEHCFGHILQDWHGSIFDAYNDPNRDSLREAMKQQSHVACCANCERYGR